MDFSSTCHPLFSEFSSQVHMAWEAHFLSVVSQMLRGLAHPSVGVTVPVAS